MDKKPKVVLLCSFSDKKLRSKLEFPRYYWANILRKLLHMSNENDFAVWDTNAIAELEKHDDVEIHVVAPHSGISRLHEFEDKGIYYHIFWSEWDIIVEKIKRKLNIRNLQSYRHHRKTIANIIKKINPDIVHVIGIENKFHSMAVLDLPQTLPIIAQLQTLVSDDRFKNNTKASIKEYQFDSDVEKLIIRRANYIGTLAVRFREIIKKVIKPDAIFVDTTLALSEKVNQDEAEKQYDFVYFAADISKAADWAIEAFALAHKKHPDITLDIIGGFSKDFKETLDTRLQELNITSQVVFEGKLPTHQDVITQIRKSKFAILPLKIDLVSGTIREAMANGLPVVTTETPSTPKLNKNKQTVLIAPNGDFKAMSDHMCVLMENQEFAETIRKNALDFAAERKSNKDIIDDWVRVYFDILNDKVCE